jgi:hypothetical protein
MYIGAIDLIWYLCDGGNATMNYQDQQQEFDMNSGFTPHLLCNL